MGIGKKVNKTENEKAFKEALRNGKITYNAIKCVELRFEVHPWTKAIELETHFGKEEGDENHFSNVYEKVVKIIVT